MRAPSNNRLMSALLFALVLIAVIYTSFWYYTMKKTEEGLVTSLRDILGGDVSYDYAEWKYDLSRISIVVKNVVSQFKDQDTGNTYVHHLGNLKVNTDLMQNFHVVIDFPQQQRIEVKKEQDILSKYLINLDEAELSFYPNIEGGELIFSTDAIYIIGKNEEKILAGTDMFFTKSGGGRTVKPNTWRFSTNKLHWYIPIFDKPISIYSFLLNAELRRFPSLTMNDVYAFLLQREKDAYGTLINSLLQDLQQRGSTIAINEFRLVKTKEDWSSIAGDIQFNQKLQPQGLLSISTNQAGDIVNWLSEKGIIEDNFLARNSNIRKLVNKKEALLELSLQLRDATSYFNGLIAGENQPMANIIGIPHSNKPSPTE